MKLKVAVIGTGAMGKNHARVYSEMKNAELAAVCDANKDTGEAIAKLHNVKYYSDYKELISKEKLDAVSVCVPTKFHRDVAVYAIRNKINIIVEKPIATTVEEAEEIISEAKKNGVKLMIGHIECFNPVVVELKKRISDGDLGKIYKVHCNRMGPSVQRIYDVGVVIDLAIHEIYILQYLTESEIKRVYAETERKIHSAHEDLLTGTIRFRNDVLGVVNTNWITPRKFREITVTGEKGMFVANYLTQELDFYENDFIKKNVDYKSHTMLVLEGRKVSLNVKKSEPLRNELDAFVSCVLNDEKVPVTGNEGLEALRVAQKFLESSKQNKVIDL